MAAGKEIKRLREAQERKVSVAKAASLIGVDPERLRKWEQRDADPTEAEDIGKIQNYFGVFISELKNLDSFQFRSQGSYKLDTTIRTSNQPLPFETKALPANFDRNQFIETLKTYATVVQKNNETLLRILDDKITTIETKLDKLIEEQKKLTRIKRDTHNNVI